MPKYLEWDYDNPKHRQRRRRQPPPLDGEILEPEPTPPVHHVKVTVHHRQRHSAPPAWIVPLAIIVALMFVSPYALVVSIVLISVFLTMHPTIAIAIGIWLLLVIGIAIHQRWRGHPF